MEPIKREAFDQLIAEALDLLPAELASLIDNVVLLGGDRGDPPDLLGLYDGVPLTERGDYGRSTEMVMPDRIYLYRLALCEICGDLEELRHELAVTLVHEVAHHFGIEDDRLEELGWG